MPDIDKALQDEWADTHARYRELFGETFCSFGVMGRPEAMRRANAAMQAALDGRRGPVRDAELGLDVPKDASI